MFRETGYDEYLYWFGIFIKEDLKVIHKRCDALDEYIKDHMDERLDTYRMTEMKNELKQNEELLNSLKKVSDFTNGCDFEYTQCKNYIESINYDIDEEVSEIYNSLIREFYEKFVVKDGRIIVKAEVANVNENILKFLLGVVIAIIITLLIFFPYISFGG